MLISSLDLPVFSGLAMVSKDHTNQSLIFKHQHWMDSMTEAKTSLSCNDYFPNSKLWTISRISKAVLLAHVQCMAPIVAQTGMRIVVQDIDKTPLGGIKLLAV